MTKKTVIIVNKGTTVVNNFSDYSLFIRKDIKNGKIIIKNCKIQNVLIFFTDFEEIIVKNSHIENISILCFDESMHKISTYDMKNYTIENRKKPTIIIKN